MKKLTKISKILLLVVAVLTMTQCRKAIEPVYQIPNYNGEKVLFTLTADNGSKGTRTEISQAGDILNVTWSAEDVIYVAGSEQGYLGSLTIQSGSGTGSATFSGEITPISKTQTIRVYYLGKSERDINDNATTINIGTQAGTLDDIENYHIASDTITNVAAGTTSLTDVELETQLAIVNVDLSGFTSGSPMLYGNGVFHAFSLDFTSGTLSGVTGAGANNYDNGIQIETSRLDSTYIALLPGNDVSMTFEYRPTSGIPTSAAFPNKNLAANTFYSFTENGNGIVPLPVGALDGLFSVSSTKKVYFSQGNLLYQIDPPAWKFANNQSTVEVDGCVNLFGWGTSGYNGASPTNYYDDDTYAPELLDIAETNYDWGHYNTINAFVDDNSIITNGWRTLTYDEWNYLINNNRKCLAVIATGISTDSIHCFILLPEDGEDFGLKLINLSDPDNPNNTFRSNKLQFTDVKILTDAGVLILPVTGYREGNTLSENSSVGAYWTSSANTSSEEEPGASYFSFEGADEVVIFGVDLEEGWVTNEIYVGKAVRLVKDY